MGEVLTSLFANQTIKYLGYTVQVKKNFVIEDATKYGKITIYGSGKHFPYVKDVADIVIELIEKDTEEKKINIGSLRLFDINSIAKIIIFFSK